MLDEHLRAELEAPASAYRWISGEFGWLKDVDLGLSAQPRPVGPDLEVVRIVPLGQLRVENGVHRHRGTVAGIPLLMRSMPDRSWRVAGLTDFE